MREDLVCPKCGGQEFDMVEEWGSIAHYDCYCSCGHEWHCGFNLYGDLISEEKEN